MLSLPDTFQESQESDSFQNGRRGSVIHKESKGTVFTRHNLITIDAGMESCSGKTKLQITELKGEAEELDSQGEEYLAGI